MNRGAWKLGIMLAIALLARASAEETGADTRSVLEGRWTFTTVAKGNLQKAPKYSQTFTLEYNPETRAFTGSVFGRKITDTSGVSAEPGGRVRFQTDHKIGGGYDIRWTGRMSEDGTAITDGEFRLRLGNGTFTAQKLPPGAPGPKEPRRNAPPAKAPKAGD